MKINYITLALALSAGFLLGAAPASAEHGGLESLRGFVELSSTPKAPDMVKYRQDDAPVLRNYVQQPPVIPHKIRDYTVDLRSNKCLSCHSWERYKQSGATKVSLTHFVTRGGHALATISPRRYFCLQCHVPQAIIDPLIGNSYQSTTELLNQ